MATNLDAAGRLVASLEEAGLVDDTLAALVQSVLSLAEAVDLDPGNASLWREYRAAEGVLRDVTRSNEPDAFFALLEEFRGT